MESEASASALRRAPVRSAKSPSQMQITTTIADTRAAIAAARRRDLTIGLVPTMGALHAGHASLFRAARRETGFVAASIFVNPTQFGPNEDFAKYPRSFDRDVEIGRAEGVDLIFHPDPTSLYPPGFRSYVEVHQFQNVLCGMTRPTHFRGVATVVLKLFNITQPDVAYFGQKDAQQARILEQMARDLDVPVRITICPIVREPDGLAMSSRNQYLDAKQRQNATVLFRALEEIRRRVDGGERRAEPLLRLARDMVAATPGAQLDYAELIAWENLQPLATIQGKVLIALAVFFGTTRLIDNLLLTV
jgi:pantoate--beta-alanine ligase